MSLYEKIKALSPIEIFRLDLVKFAKKAEKYDARYLDSQHWFAACIDYTYKRQTKIARKLKMPNKFIVINTVHGFNKYEESYLMLHEIGHAIDPSKKYNYFKSEVFAEKYAMKKILEFKSKTLARVYTNFCNRQPISDGITTHVMKLKTYQKVKELAGEK